MADEKLAQALRALGRSVEGTPVELAGSMSQSGVYRVKVDGRDAVVKATAAGRDQRIARRELTFYLVLADRVPVRTPTLINYVDTDDQTVLLLSAHTPGPPAREWDDSAWLEVARQLAALHSMQPPDGDPWLRKSWVRRLLDHPPADAEAFWSNSPAADHVGDVFADTTALAHALNAVPDRFVHGDCHVDNLLRDGDEIVWADWQGAGIASPAGDLSGLWERAYSDGADPPRDAMLKEYATCRGIDPAPLRLALLATELSSTLLAWPEYFGYLTPSQQDRLTQRLIRLIRDWKQR